MVGKIKLNLVRDFWGNWEGIEIQEEMSKYL